MPPSVQYDVFGIVCVEDEVILLSVDKRFIYQDLVHLLIFSINLAGWMVLKAVVNEGEHPAICSV